MNEFIMRHQKSIRGVLSGFDRIRFRGTLRWLANTAGMKNFLWTVQVLLKHFGVYSMDITNQIKAATAEIAEAAGRPVVYVNNSPERKEEIARQIAKQDGVTEGLIAVLTSVEPCLSYEVGPNAMLRFLGKKLPMHGGVHGNFEGEVITDLKTRPEGMRLKHTLNHNSLKMYNKQHSVLRIETTINNTRDMKINRRPEGEPEGKLAWRRLRKGVADIPRRVEISQAANERYLESLAAVETDASLNQLTKPLCQPVMWQGRRARALNPWAVADGRLLEIINHGEFMINGFRNRDVRALLYGEAGNPKEERRQSAAVTRSLRLLRAHKLIKKVPKTHRYVLTQQGVKSVTAILSAREARAAKLTQLAG